VCHSCRSQRPHKDARSSPEFVHGARETINVRSAFTNNYGLPRKLSRQTTWLHQLILRPETVAVALSQSDQEGLAEFLTEYFASNNNEFLSGK
jgi:hypothetical protein